MGALNPKKLLAPLLCFSRGAELLLGPSSGGLEDIRTLRGFFASRLSSGQRGTLD